MPKRSHYANLHVLSPTTGKDEPVDHGSVALLLQRVPPPSIRNEKRRHERPLSPGAAARSPDL
jgi:hypothetical protein